MRKPKLKAEPLPADAPTVCCICGSADWHRCVPGEAPDAECYQDTNIVPLSPGPGVPAVAWCLEHDPLVVRAAEVSAR